MANGSNNLNLQFLGPLQELNSSYAHSTTSQPNASAAPIHHFVHNIPHIPPVGMYPVPNWHTPSPPWQYGPMFSAPTVPLTPTSTHWISNPFGVSQIIGPQPPPLPTPSIEDFARIVVGRVRSILHDVGLNSRTVAQPAVIPNDTRSADGALGSSSREDLNPSRTVTTVVHEAHVNVGDEWTASISSSSTTSHSGIASRTSSPLTQPSLSERSMESAESSEYHAHAYIPPSVNFNKPRAPSRDPHGDIDTFSNDEKVFFIHFLRWRLREGPVPPKLVLWWELGREAPHHDHLSWKKHWEEHPSMPDRIYSEARRRRDRETEMDSTRRRRRTVSPPVTLRLENKHPNLRVVHLWPSSSKGAVQPITRRRVTDDDIKAMALYMVEKRQVWNKFTSHAGCWREFANRPQNRARRNLHAWDSIARKQSHRIKAAFDEFMELDENEGERNLGYNTTISRHLNQAQVGQPQPTASTSTVATLVDIGCTMDTSA